MFSVSNEVFLAFLNWKMEERSCFYDHISAWHLLTQLALQTGSEWVIQHFSSLCLCVSSPLQHPVLDTTRLPTLLALMTGFSHRLLNSEKGCWQKKSSAENQPRKKPTMPTMPNAPCILHAKISFTMKDSFGLSYFSLYLESNNIVLP